MSTIVFGRVPMFSFTDRYIAEKKQGFGWDNLGQRDVYWVTLHRMVGKLWGTDGWFRNPAVSSITDFGIGNAVTSGAANDGLILRWNDPLGIRSGWASGPVSTPYGDGLAAVNKYGINGVNRFGVSIEGDGTDEPFSANAWAALVRFIAYWADYAKVPYTDFPLNPHTGFSFVIFHEEFTYGTGKRCPFPWLKGKVLELIADVKAYLQKYQLADSTPIEAAKFRKGQSVSLGVNRLLMQAPKTDAKIMTKFTVATPAEVIDLKLVGDDWWYDVKGQFGTGWMIEGALAASDIKPPVIPVPPTVTYATPSPVAALAMADPDTVGDIKINNGTNFMPVFDDIECIKPTKQFQYAYATSKVIGPDLQKGDRLHASFRFTGLDDGKDYYYTSNHARVLVECFKRISD